MNQNAVPRVSLPVDRNSIISLSGALTDTKFSRAKSELCEHVNALHILQRWLPLFNPRSILSSNTMLLLSTLFAASTFAVALPKREDPVNTTTCNGQTYSYLGLAGYGYTPSNSRDKFGDTAGGIGSSAAIESWTLLENGSYTGILHVLPDRGWNTEGTLNYQPRVHKYEIVFTPCQEGSSPNLILNYLDSIRFFADANGTLPFSGLDASVLPPYLATSDGTTLPSTTYEGNGFGGDGPGGTVPDLDSEGLVLMPDGTMYVSDEYGDYIYHFTAEGNLITAIPPPDAFLPIRNDSVSFSAASPPRYDPNLETIPEDPDSGRVNNQGFEGLTRSPDAKYLYALTQSGLVQDGGDGGGKKRRWARLVQMDLEADEDVPPVVAQYVVPLPVYEDADGKNKVAAQSEIHYISDTQFFVLARDGNGRGENDTESLYRHADVFDISNATDVNGMDTIAPDGKLADGIDAAEYCPFLDYNINSELAKFDLHNGGDENIGLLNPKWESFALVPVNPTANKRDVQHKHKTEEYFLFSLSDNDFITQDGYMNGGQLPYADESGYNLLNQVLVFKVELPAGSNPLAE